jgi:capsular exopolysaccharide synthesis family protein
MADTARQGGASEVRTILRALRRRWWIVALCTVAVAATAYALSSRQTSQYTSSASLLFRDSQLGQTLFGSPSLGISRDPSREANTNVRLVSLKGIARRTARALAEPPYAARVAAYAPGRRIDEDYIASRTTVNPEGQSDVVRVSFLDRSPRLAALVANVFALQYIEFRREADQAKVQTALDLVQTQLQSLTAREQNTDEARSLRRRGEQLRILRALQTGNAELVQPAEVPEHATSPSPRRAAAVGVLLGLLLGFAIALLLERLDRRIRDAKEVEELFDRPLVGSVPQSGGSRLGSEQAEAYRLLRANLRYFNVGRDVHSVLITSAASGDGKTTIAWNLAATAAQTGSHVLLMETDLRRPTVARRSELNPAPGLTNLLASDIPFEEVIQPVPVGLPGAQQDRTMDVLVAGPLPPNPTDLIESERMRELLKFAESRYDLVIVDTPPTSVVSDAIPLTREVSGVLVVCRLGQSTIDAVTRLRDQLRHLDAPVLGVVVNGLKSGDGGYGYYGYGAAQDYGPAGDTSAFMDSVGASNLSANGNGDEAEEPARGRGRKLLRRGR